MQTIIEYKQIKQGSASYYLAVALRLNILLDPLGLTLSPKDLATEKTSLHFVALLNQQVVGTVLLTPEENGKTTSFQLRQMAVSSDMQSHGVGSNLLGFVERSLKDYQDCYVWCNAQLTAQRFYEKNGFQIVGEPFTLEGLPHIKMQKTL
ncbi:MAG: GNAT family N-acetyltransferase [Vampirovibrionales bacterium]